MKVKVIIEIQICNDKYCAACCPYYVECDVNHVLSKCILTGKQVDLRTDSAGNVYRSSFCKKARERALNTGKRDMISYREE